MQESISNQAKISLLILASMGVMSGIAIVTSLPLISKHFFHIEDIDFLSKLLLTIPAIFVAIFAPIVGIISDKTSRLKPLFIGIILFIISGTSGFYLNNFYHILIGRALFGISVAIIMTSSIALIGDYFSEKERHKFMSLQGMTVGLSGVAFIILGGYLAELNWTYSFLIYALPIVFLPLIFTSLKEPKKINKDSHVNEEIKINLFPVYLTGFFSMLLFYMLPTQIPYLVINKLNGTPTLISYFIASAMLTNAIVARQYHYLKEKFSFSGIFVIVYIFFSIGLFIISQVTNVYQLYLSSVFMGVGFGLITVNINMWLLSLVPSNKRGKAVGILTSSFFLGQFFSPILFEPVIKQVGIQGLFLFVSILSLCIALFILAKNIKAK